MAEARSEYGIVFRKDFVIHKWRQSDHVRVQGPRRDGRADANSEERKIRTRTIRFGELPRSSTPPGKYGNSTYFFEWEREWRKAGHFKFSEDDVAFLIIPEKLHKAARGFFDNAKVENLGPCYECPFIDSFWNRKKIKPLLPKYAEENEA